MTTISVLVVPEVVRNKPETERNHTVKGDSKGWQKLSLNQDPHEILTECEGLDQLLTKCNLHTDGETKVDPALPVGFQVSYEIYDPNVVLSTGVTVTPPTITGKVGDVVTFIAQVAPANATYHGVSWTCSDLTAAEHVGGGSFELLKAGSFTVTAVTVEGNHKATAALTINNADGTSVLTFSTNVQATQNAVAGADATFTVAMTGGKAPYTYKWYYSNVPGGAGKVITTVSNPTANAASLVVPAVTAASEGEYWVVVTDADHNTATSKRGELAVLVV